MSRETIMILLGSLTAVCLLTPNLDAQDKKKKKKTSVEKEMADIRQARTTIEGYVKALKVKFCPDKPECGQMTLEYNTKVFPVYDGWVTALKGAIMLGHGKNLDENQDYKDRANKAGAAAEAFIKHSEDLLKLGRGVTIADIIKGLADAGMTIWDKYSKGKQEQRTKNAEFVEKEIKWQDWNAIK